MFDILLYSAYLILAYDWLIGTGPVGTTLVVARTTLVVDCVVLPTPTFAGAGRHKGVPYDGPAMRGVSDHSPETCCTPGGRVAAAGFAAA